MSIDKKAHLERRGWVSHYIETGEYPSGVSDDDKAWIMHSAHWRELYRVRDGKKNLRAWQALEGDSSDWVRDLLALLYSDVPIHTHVRRQLAKAIEGKSYTGIRLELIGGGSFRDEAKAIEARREWVKIGEWIDAKIGAGEKRKDALMAATDHFAASMEKCEAALTYSRRHRSQLDELEDHWVSPDMLHRRDYYKTQKKRGRLPRGSASRKR